MTSYQTNGHGGDDADSASPQESAPAARHQADDALRPSVQQKAVRDKAKQNLESMRAMGYTPEQLAAQEKAFRREQDEWTLCHLAELTAREIVASQFRPIIKELVLMAELEREAIRRDGVGRSLLTGLRQAGIRLRLDDEGRLLIGPPKALTREWRRFIGIYRSEIIRELNWGW